MPVSQLSMEFSLETLVALATIIGTVASILAFVQIGAWLVLTCLVFVGLAIFAGWYARRQRGRVKASSIEIEGHSIDSLNMANIKRRINRTLVIQEALHTARIEGDNLEIFWEYAGYCRTSCESAIEFSVDSDNSTPFTSMTCTAFDLVHDPQMTRPIRPLHIGSDGISHKLAVPFLEPLGKHSEFRVVLRCSLPGCLRSAFGYYSATLSFAHENVRRTEVRLIFTGHLPEWVRVYDCNERNGAALLKSLAPVRKSRNEAEYLDAEDFRSAQSARVYAFWRHTTS